MTNPINGCGIENAMRAGAILADVLNKKRDFRKLWIARINAACRPLGISYSRLMNGLKKQKISINRKMLSELAINQPKEFEKLVKQVQSANKK